MSTSELFDADGRTDTCNTIVTAVLLVEQHYSMQQVRVIVQLFAPSNLDTMCFLPAFLVLRIPQSSVSCTVKN